MDFFIQYIMGAGMISIWIFLILLFSVIEMAGPALVSIWFVAGALAALLVTFLGASINIQIIVFLVVSFVCLIFARKFTVNYLNVGKVKTNVEDFIGKRAVVIKEISEFSYGEIKLKGVVWTAKSFDNRTIEAKCEVEVVAIEGVKLVVKTLD